MSMDPRRAGRRPNVLLVTVDALRADHLGCYGYGKRTSPRLDAFAASATLFEHAWAAGTSTPFSLPALMASRMAFESAAFGVADAEVTLAELLRQAGYRTQAFHASNPYLSHYFGYDRGFDGAVDLLEYKPADNLAFRHVDVDERVGRLAGGARPGVRGAARRLMRALTCVPPLSGLRRGLKRLDSLTARHLDWLPPIRIKRELERRFPMLVRRWLKENAGTPFFLWVHPMTVHEPYAPLWRHQLAVNGRLMGRGRINGLSRTVILPNQVEGGPIRPRDVRDMTDLYDAEVRRADDFLGGLFACLRRAGWWDSTVVIVAADHGEQLYEHGRFFHPSLHYNEVLRVPLLVRLPGQREGRRVRADVGLVDLLPTLSDVLGLRLPQGACWGRSFARMLGDGGPAPQGIRLYASESYYGAHETFYRLNTHDVREAGRRVSFQNHAVKLAVDCTRGRCQVFDLRADAGERRDLSDSRPELALIARRLARLHVRRCERGRLRRLFPEGPRAAVRRRP